MNFERGGERLLMTIISDDELDLILFTRFRQFSDLQLQRIVGFQGRGLILTLLHKHGTLTQRQLSEMTQRRSATLSEQLDGMEKAGLIVRNKNASDKRNIDVVLTEEGEKIAKKADRTRTKTAHSLFAILSHDEKLHLLETLARLITAEDREPIFGATDGAPADSIT